MISEDNIRIMITLPKKLNKLINEISEKEGQTKSEIIKKILIEKYFDPEQLTLL